MSHSKYIIGTTGLPELHTVIHAGDCSMPVDLVNAQLVTSAATVQSTLESVNLDSSKITESKILTLEQQAACLSALEQRFNNPPKYYNPQYIRDRTPFINFLFIKTILLRSPAALYAIFTLMEHGGEVDFLCIKNNQLIFAEMNEVPPVGEGRRKVTYEQICNFLSNFGAELITPKLYTFLLNTVGYFENGDRCIVLTNAELLTVGKMLCGELHQREAFFEERIFNDIQEYVGFRAIVRVHI